ncbi:MAG: disulfide bond formation protein B [Chlamydiales bacterium]|nr:disulfide bond formation protein B [Chlamydiales bacterium]
MTERFFNALEVLIIAAIILTALSLQIFFGESPCPLCLLQRLFMFGIGAAIILNLKCGIRKRHYGLAIIAAIFGSIISLRQIAFHVCPGSSKFGAPFWGISLYTWALIIFAISIVYNALMMVIFTQEGKHKLSWFDTLCVTLLFIAACINVGATLHHCGFGPCHEDAFKHPGEAFVVPTPD